MSLERKNGGTLRDFIFYYLSELRISFFYGVDILAESSAIFCIFCVKSVFQCN